MSTKSYYRQNKKALLYGLMVAKTALKMSKNRMCVNRTRKKKDCTCLTLSLDSGVLTELIFYLLNIPALFLKRNISCRITILLLEQWDRLCYNEEGKKNPKMRKTVRNPQNPLFKISEKAGLFKLRTTCKSRAPL